MIPLAQFMYLLPAGAARRDHHRVTRERRNPFAAYLRSDAHTRADVW
ncbi:MAG: hypothetical protein M0Z33_11375 [Actinomycetota bacterium]|nr:hypothetical protein [Actinomycetota bacterium]